MFGWEFAPLIAGGLGVVCRALSTSLASQDQQIAYVLPRIPDKVGFTYEGIRFRAADVSETAGLTLHHVDGVPISAYSSFNDPANRIYITAEAEGNPALAAAAGRPLYGEDLLHEVEVYREKANEIAAEEDFDVIHNHDWMTVPAAIEAKESSHKPLVMHVHATEYERTLGNPHPDIFNLELKGMEAADTIIAVSELTKERIVANYGIKAEKIVVIHNAIEQVERRFGPIAKSTYRDDRIVLFLARLTAMKGADYLLEAAAKVLPVLPNTKFLFVGAGELLPKLVERSAELGIAHKVTFTGFLPHDQVDRVYRHADVFVMPSVAEPFGITPLEAIRNGTPVIISKQSGASEVLQNVLKVDFWDVEALADKLLAVLRYGVLADELISNSRRDLENLTWDKQSQKVIAVYESLAQK